MEKYLYYERGEEWVRVNADSYSQGAPAGGGRPKGGKCPGQQYEVIWYITDYEFDQIRNVVTRAPRTYNRNGFVIGGNWKGPTLEFNPTPPGAYVGNSYTWLRKNDGSAIIGYYVGGQTATNRVTEVTDYGLVSIKPRYPNSYVPCAADDEGSCETVFKLSGLTVLTLDSCPKITKGDGCGECCRQLLPLIKTLHV